MFGPSGAGRQIQPAVPRRDHTRPADENRAAAPAGRPESQGARDTAAPTPGNRRGADGRDGPPLAIQSPRGPGGEVAFRRLLDRLPGQRNALGDRAGTPAPARRDHRDPRAVLYGPDEVSRRLAAACGVYYSG